MKIIISESQLNELKAKNEKYLNQLLDKVSKSGMNSLTDDEKDAMIKMSRNEDPEMDIDQIIEFWKSLIQRAFKKIVDDEIWLINKLDDPSLTLRIVNPDDGYTFYVAPFANRQSIIRIKIEGNNFDIPLEDNEIPRSKKEIDDFNYSFMNGGLTTIIRTINSDYRFQ
jgi:hypothetical protein